MVRLYDAGSIQLPRFATDKKTKSYRSQKFMYFILLRTENMTKMPKHLRQWLVHHKWLSPEEHAYEESTKFLEACQN